MGLFSKKSKVQEAKRTIEEKSLADGTADAVFQSLGRDLTEEARIKAAALARHQYELQPVGGWVDNHGRKEESSWMDNLLEVFTNQGRFDGYLILAAVSVFFHLILLSSWVFLETSQGGVVGLVDRSVEVIGASETTVRLTTMFLCGHVVWLGVVYAVCAGGEVRWQLYAPLMVMCLILGGPACAFAVSAHCEEYGKVKALNTLEMALSTHKYVPPDELEEKRRELADVMQWVYLLLLATCLAASLSALGFPDLNPVGGAFEVDSFGLYVFWPVGLALSDLGSWITPLTGLMILDWVAVFGFGLLLASRKGAISWRNLGKG